MKLLDFGIAKVVQDAQKMGFGKTAGHITSFTPLYGAPEQFNRAYGATGPWTDVFALALVVVEIAHGTEPLERRQPRAARLRSSRSGGAPDAAHARRARSSDEVEAIFRRRSR